MGAVIGAAELLHQIEKFQDTVAICAPSLGQRAALWGLENLAQWKAEQRDEILNRRSAIEENFAPLAERGWRLLGCGAYFAYLEHPFAEGAAILAPRLVREAGVLILPATMFTPEGDASGDRQFRVAFANTDRAGIAEFARRLAQVDGPLQRPGEPHRQGQTDSGGRHGRQEEWHREVPSSGGSWGSCCWASAASGATNFSGTVRSIGKVGEAEISTNDYFRALNNEIRNFQQQSGQALSFQQAQSLGLTQQVLSQLVVTAALENEADTLGLSVGDEKLAQDLRQIQAFQGVDGSFNRDAYKLALDNAGLKEREFEEKLRSESASSLLQSAVLAGIRLPDTYVDTLIGYTGERRSITWAVVGETQLDLGLPVPTEEELRAHYDDNIDKFTRPETKRITYAWVTPEMIVDSVEVDEESLRAAYDERLEDYDLPERRLVERLVFNDTAAAEDALARITGGEISFGDLVEERGLALEDTDMGDVTRAELRDAADAVFDGDVGKVVGPAPTALGPALFRINAVLPAQVTSFEDAMPELRDDLALDRARRVIEAQAQGFDDELAAGVTLEELVGTTDLTLGEIGWTGENDEGIAGYPAFRDAAGAVEAGDYPAIGDLGDGGVFALRLDAIDPPAPIPFDEVRVRVEADWRAAQKSDALLEQAEALAAQLGEGVTFEGLELTAQTEEALTRTSFGAVPRAVLDAVFEMEPNAVRAVSTGDTAVVVRLDEILAVDPDDEQAQQLARLFRDQAAQAVAQDLFRALASDIQNRAGVDLDQAAINAVHANFQ